ncbi:hypothetical protein CDL12_25747 [Handroanthus impetiginosus]|uniref:Uncharacterized protein n=1 Tax=Handroanthus impetiginosus TaxID=429701 RepID=A0A2G9G969_9LAMI|nr:hypothetical protein CDL12_25747 [Handroanthus impetiginosus]
MLTNMGLWDAAVVNDQGATMGTMGQSSMTERQQSSTVGVHRWSIKCLFHWSSSLVFSFGMS